MFSFLDSIEDYKQFFDELQDMIKKGMTGLISGARKYVGR